MQTSSTTRVRKPFIANCLVALGLLLGLALVGCSKFDPSQWDQAQMSKEVTEQWKSYNISNVELKPVAGGFEGTAKAADGEGFEIKITTDPKAKSASGVGKGNRGTDLTFSVRPK